MDADPVATEIPQQHRDRIEVERFDRLPEASLEGALKPSLERLLELPRSHLTRELPPERSLRRRQQHDVLRKEVELAPGASTIGPNRLPMAQLAIAARRRQHCEQPCVVRRRKQVAEIDVVERLGLQRRGFDPDGKIEPRVGPSRDCLHRVGMIARQDLRRNRTIG
jgi:hypothetical protein